MFLLLAVFAAFLAYETNWIRERHVLLSEADRMHRLIVARSNYVSGQTSEDIPALGSTVLQRMLRIFGEPAVDECFVWVVLGRESDEVEGNGSSRAKEACEYRKVHRAQRLFPEAKIVFVWIDPGNFPEEWRHIEPEISE
ncbi:MAG TPA: hypothetical protein VGG64_02255 [Pirellulales bacterium]|jgi:hypothetical protein